MELTRKSLMRKALFIVSISYLLYNVYQAIVTTIFISHFPLMITQLPKLIESSEPNLQIGLFLVQELASSIGIYLRLAAGGFAVYCALLLMKKDNKYLDKFSKVIFFESLYFVLLIPAGINHIVGSIISSSALLNIYTGVSVLLQAVLIFPPLFVLSRKLNEHEDIQIILKWASIAAPLYAFGIWIKHGLMWAYALSPLGQQAGPIATVGFVNSFLTLLVAALVITIACFAIRQKKKPNPCLLGAALVLVGIYFLVYATVSVEVSIYLAFLPLTEFWMITSLILGVLYFTAPNKNRLHPF